LEFCYDVYIRCCRGGAVHTTRTYLLCMYSRSQFNIHRYRYTNSSWCIHRANTSLPALVLVYVVHTAYYTHVPVVEFLRKTSVSVIRARNVCNNLWFEWHENGAVWLTNKQGRVPRPRPPQAPNFSSFLRVVGIKIITGQVSY